MYQRIAITTFVFALIGLASCQKCHKCIAKDQDGVIRHEYNEMCGSKKDLSAYADACETEYGAYDFTCECGEADL